MCLWTLSRRPANRRRRRSDRAGRCGQRGPGVQHRGYVPGQDHRGWDNHDWQLSQV